MEPERLEIANAWKVIEAKQACFDNSRFECVGAERMVLQNASLAGTKITDANLSDLEIDGAQMGGAYIRNIGMPGEDHALYKPGAKQRSLTFENCELGGSRIVNCNLSHVEIADCNIQGLTINGVPIEEILREYEKAKQA